MGVMRRLMIKRVLDEKKLYISLTLYHSDIRFSSTRNFLIWNIQLRRKKCCAKYDFFLIWLPIMRNLSTLWNQSNLTEYECSRGESSASSYRSNITEKVLQSPTLKYLHKNELSWFFYPQFYIVQDLSTGAAVKLFQVAAVWKNRGMLKKYSSPWI